MSYDTLKPSKGIPLMGVIPETYDVIGTPKTHLTRKKNYRMVMVLPYLFSEYLMKKCYSHEDYNFIYVVKMDSSWCHVVNKVMVD